MNIAGLILAAGASRRMGSPKPLLRYENETFLDRLIGLFGEVCASVTVVLGHDAERIRHGLARCDNASFVFNPHHEQGGQTSSLKCGLSAIPASDAVLFTPVDYPTIRRETVRALSQVQCGNTGEPKFVIPRYEGRRGHPVLLAAGMIPEFLALPEDGQARHVVHRYVGETVYIDVSDPGIMRDVDDPAAYAELTSSAYHS